MSRILYYRCKVCKVVIDPNQVKSLQMCSCGKIGIDVTPKNTRILGKLEFVDIIWDGDPQYEVVYKIQNIYNHKYFKPSTHSCPGNFSSRGKIYTSKPSLRWVPDPSNWKIVEFRLEKT